MASAGQQISPNTKGSSMTTRELYATTRPYISPSSDDAEIERVAATIRRESAAEGQPVGELESYERAALAMYEVCQMAEMRGVQP